MKTAYLLTLSLAFSILASPASAQLNRLKNKIENKAEDAVIDAMFGKKKDKNDSDSDSAETPTPGGRSKAQNKGGAGLNTTPPDVNKHLSLAESSYKASSYGKARSELRQAMQGVELEIGRQILASLPESINGLNKEASSDYVTSTGWGWAGLTISRLYTDGNEKELQVVVANNGALLHAMNVYLAGGGYTSSEEQQNWKQTSVNGHNAIISYDDYEGYKISIPIGQASALIFEGVNFTDENDIMLAANKVNIEDIKKKLGEQ